MTGTDQLQTIDTTPAMPALVSDFMTCVDSATHLVTQQATDYETRFALWSGQSADGKKKYGDDPKPWKNASDVRVFEADAVVAEQVELMMAAWNLGTMQLSTTEPQNRLAALKAQQYLQALFRTQLRQEAACEVQRYAQWRQMYGLAAMGVYWEQQREVEPLTFDLFKLAASLNIEPNGPQLLALKEKLMDPFSAPLLEEMFLTTFEGVTKREAAEAVRDFRATATCVIPRVRTVRAQPRWVAMRPWVDLVFPPSARDIQRVPRCYVREWLSPDELQDRATQYNYDRKWVEEALKQRGKGRSQYGDNLGYMTTQRTGTDGWGTNEDTRQRDLIEVIHAYHRAPDKHGRMLRACTVFQPGVPELYASHGPLPYAHGKWPFVIGAREVVDVALAESRSVADIVRHDQDVIKDEVDGRRDAAKMATLPPLVKPLRRALERLVVGPAAQWTEQNVGELRFMAPPVNPSPSIEVENASRSRIDRRFGRPGSTATPELQRLYGQGLVNSFLTEVSAMGLMTLQLAQQYLDATSIDVVTNNTFVTLFTGSREDIQGQHNVTLSFSVDNLSNKEAMEKLNGIMEVAKLDRHGVLDFAGLAGEALALVDPSLAARFVRTEQQATEIEAAEEIDALVKILSGIEPPPPPENANAGLRSQVLQKHLQANPILAQIVQTRPDQQAMLEARMKQLQFIDTQRQNAVIGRTGAESGLAQLQKQQPAA
jgi:hypothetical protein